MDIGTLAVIVAVVFILHRIKAGKDEDVKAYNKAQESLDGFKVPENERGVFVNDVSEIEK